MGSGSKYETMAKAIEKKIEELNKGANDNIKQKQLEQKLKRIDKETDRKIKELKATPIDNEQIKKEAETDYENQKIQIKRKVKEDVSVAKQNQEELEVVYAKEKKRIDSAYEKVSEDSKIYEEKENIRAKQEYDRRLASINNTTELLEIQVDKLKDDSEKQKETIEIELDNVKAVNESKTSKMECLDKLYDDIKEISLKLGDGNK